MVHFTFSRNLLTLTTLLHALGKRLTFRGIVVGSWGIGIIHQVSNDGNP